MDIKLTVGDERSTTELWGNVAEALDMAGFYSEACEVDTIFNRLCRNMIGASPNVHAELVRACWDTEIIPLLETLGSVTSDGSKVVLHVG